MYGVYIGFLQQERYHTVIHSSGQPFVRARTQKKSAYPYTIAWVAQRTGITHSTVFWGLCSNSERNVYEHV